VSSGVYYGSYRSAYRGTSYYPWWSIDYFYLGYYPRFYGPFAYYSPYFYPYYFSVLYPPWQWRNHYWSGGYYAWSDPYRHHRYRRHDSLYPGQHDGGSGHNGPVPVGDSNASEPVSRPGLQREIGDGSWQREIENRASMILQPQQPSNSQRQIYTAPSTGFSNRGMKILSPVSRKDRPVRVDPIQPSGLTATVQPSPVSSAPVSVSRAIISRPVNRAPTPVRRSNPPARVSIPVRSSSSQGTSASLRSSAYRYSAGAPRDNSKPDRAGLDSDRH